jgi:hypothetical protein
MTMTEFVVLAYLGIITFAMVVIGMTLDKIARSLETMADEARAANRRGRS